MRSLKKKKGFMAIKIDLEKAYDRVNWGFLLACLQELQIPASLRSVIAQCVSTSNMQLLWNGDKAETFRPSRGLRQGDPLSPYLFVICMEKLAHIIQGAVHEGNWRPIRLTRAGPPISHLFFADDILLFAEASMDQALLINESLQRFCESSGLKVNQQKTRVFFSKNVNHIRRNEICATMGFSITSDLGKYLGIPLHHKRVTKDSYHFVVDKVRTRLSKWKVNSLSLAGRTTLISSVTTSIPGYVMQTSLLPASTCEALEQCNRRFLWGGTEEQRKIPLVAWDVLCTPKNRGGLGLRHAHYHNHAYLMKVGWNLSARKNDFWVKVIRDKYNCGSDLLPPIDMSKRGSNLWSGIKKTWDKVQDGTEVLDTGQLRWKWTKSGFFSVKSAYDSLICVPHSPDPLWNRIWKMKIHERCKLFGWLAVHKRLLTNASRHRRGLSMDSSCPVCCAEVENQMHVLRDCPITADLWKCLAPQRVWHTFSSMEDFEQWFRWNISTAGDSVRSENWRLMFLLTCWWLWRRRNLFVFEAKRISNCAIQTSVAATMQNLLAVQSKLGSLQHMQPSRYGHGSRWTLPPSGWIKVNTDGAFSHFCPGIACGGVLRDEQGNFIRAFMFKGEDGDALSAELWGCLHGLKVAWDMGHRYVILETDSADAFELIKNEINVLHADHTLIDAVKQLLQRNWQVEVKHIRRGANMVADHLAKKGLSSLPGFHTILFPEYELDGLIVRDRS